MKKKINLVTLLLLILISGCKKEHKEQKIMNVKTEKFEWLATVSGDEFCPVEIIDGSFVLSDGNTIGIPSGEYLNADWGASSGIMLVGDEMKKVPERMEITWFSYAENKFYKGDFALPQEKIYDIFKKDYGKSKYPNGDEYINRFSSLLVGIAPQGLVTVWMDGIGSIEIGTFLAQETFDEKWSDFSKNLDRVEVVKNYQKDMLPFVQEQIAQNKISSDYFKNRLQRYHYTIGTNKPDFKIYDYNIEFLNSEVIHKCVAGLEFLTDITHAKGIASDMTLFIKGTFVRNLEVRIWVDVFEGKTTDDRLNTLEEGTFNNQLMSRYKAFFEQNKDVQLYIKFDDDIVRSNINIPVYSGKVCLKSPTAEMEIPNSKVEVYDVE
jgi:hypothetical protein